MIVEALLDALVSLIMTLFSWIELPTLPDSAMQVIDMLFSYIEMGMGLLSIFLNMDLVRVMIPLVIVVVNFDKAYHLVIFVLRKIPFLNIG